MNFRASMGLDYKDVLLVPKYWDGDSRSHIDTSSYVGNLELKLPVFSANMDTITNANVAKEMSIGGAAGILHRYQDTESTYRDLKILKEMNCIAIPSIGAGPVEVDKAKYYCELDIDAICIDIAHGDSQAMIDTIKAIRKFTDVNIIAGNIATAEAGYRLVDAGANILKVGIGPGYVCTTRKQTGAGFPQLSAIMDIAEGVRHPNLHWIIADGGIRETGDIAKALAAGASAVMTGYLFAGSQDIGKETYRGMASLDAQHDFKGFAKNIEGRSTNVETKGSIKDILQSVREGIQSSFSYCGAHNIEELRRKAEFVILN